MMKQYLISDFEIMRMLSDIANNNSISLFPEWFQEIKDRGPAQLLDLEGVERHGLVEDSTWYNCLQAKEDGDYVRYSDLHNLVAPVIGREEMMDMMDGLGKSDDEGRGWAIRERDFGKLADAILDRIKGVR
jgi:hypothetical protein